MDCYCRKQIGGLRKGSSQVSVLLSRRINKARAAAKDEYGEAEQACSLDVVVIVRAP